ncbi:phosphotransferase [Micromonospora arida]
MLQRLAATARHRADGAERPPFGLCHGEFHRTSLHVSRTGCRLVDWAKAFCGPGLFDLATWFGTRTPTEPDYSPDSSTPTSPQAGIQTPKPTGAGCPLPDGRWAGTGCGQPGGCSVPPPLATTKLPRIGAIPKSFSGNSRAHWTCSEHRRLSAPAAHHLMQEDPPEAPRRRHPCLVLLLPHLRRWRWA